MRRDDRKVSWATIASSRPCHLMAWSEGIWIIYIVNLFANKQVLTEQVNRLCTRCCTQHLTHTPTFPRLLWLHIGMWSRRSLNRLILSANAWVHSWLPCHEHNLSKLDGTVWMVCFDSIFPTGPEVFPGLGSWANCWTNVVGLGAGHYCSLHLPICQDGWLAPLLALPMAQ
jgi:hypothetical protein